MKISFVETDNIRKLVKAMGALEGRDAEIPGLGLIYGRAGLGKTKAVSWYAVNHDSIYLRGAALWTPHWMLTDLCAELRQYPERYTAQLFGQVMKALKKSDRPVFIDEADYLLRDSRMLDTVRDLHDKTNIPIVLIGMEQITGKLIRKGQFWSRLSQIIEFQPLTPGEIAFLAKTWANLKTEAGASEILRKATAGDFREVTVALYHLERMAKANKSDAITEVMVRSLMKKTALGRKDHEEG